jgi:hypothetical protein
LGVLGVIVAQKAASNSEALRLALGVGFLGAFTTFSTFEFETHALFDDGSWVTATANMFARARLLELPTDLPIVIEIVDAEDKVDAFLPTVDELDTEGLVTLEAVRILRYVSPDSR